MDSVLKIGYDLLDRGLVPDFILRRAIRLLLRQRLREIDHGSLEANHAAKMKFVEDVKARTTIAEVPEKANEQHYEVSTEFILSTLGPYAKYSSCLYPTGRETLDEAERLMLESYCEKAMLRDGLDILDLGCGWGSLSLFLAEKYPNSRITGLSNSSTQKAHIDSRAKEKGLTNVEIITADVNTHDFNGSKTFDRILSIEMFEHMKNYEALFKKVSTWLRPTNSSDENTERDEALLFVHIFCHRTTPYHFEEDDGWMAQNFFSGGTMPSHDLFLYFQTDLTLVRNWYLPGTHYSRTLEDWLTLQDKNGKSGSFFCPFLKSSQSQVATEFMLSTLGPYGKYSSCLYPTGRETLDEAERLMMESYCEKANFRDGLDILDLGCGACQPFQYDSKACIYLTVIFTLGWGSFVIFLAEKYPNARITGMSNSKTQKLHIDKKVKERGFTNVEVLRGTMPSHDLFLYFQNDLTLIRSWYLSGMHYSRTHDHWLATQDKNRKIGLRILEEDAKAKGHSPEVGRRTFYRFRVFYIACSEFFKMDGGEQWGVGHYLFKRK
ncbi:hypothetical protein CVT24_003425 [Panaeolus cyanescens]|uniref:Methyltransferase domain-containing protein n=1 Tax=Panaeolus cyanescens TaxID=181874 RepID=A0A409Y6P9_9AGAR|nr:hypothetical protein CVT24_003425 [Panaeolus cyanescens]